jgi:N-carbamoylputrescine amidase
MTAVLRNSISHPTLAFAPGRPDAAKSVCWCWDQWYPEGARSPALQGKNPVYPTAIGGIKEKTDTVSQHGAWERRAVTRSPKNAVIAVANRIGFERPVAETVSSSGPDFVAGTSGQILAKASTNREEVLVVPVDLSKVDVTRTHWPFCATGALTLTAG